MSVSFPSCTLLYRCDSEKWFLSPCYFSFLPLHCSLFLSVCLSVCWSLSPSLSLFVTRIFLYTLFDSLLFVALGKRAGDKYLLSVGNWVIGSSWPDKLLLRLHVTYWLLRCTSPNGWSMVGMHGDFSYHPFTDFTCGEAIPEVGHLELILISYSYLSFLRKKFMVQGEDKLKGSAQANLEIDKGLNENTRPVPIWRRALANWRRAIGHTVTVNRPYRPLPVTACVEGMLPACSFVCDRSDKRRKDTKTSEFDKDKT